MGTCSDGGRWAHLARITLAMAEGTEPDLADTGPISEQDRELVREALARDRFPTPRALQDLPDLTLAEKASSFSLFTRLIEFGSVDQAAIRYATLQGVYGLRRPDLFAHLIAGHLRAAIQRRSELAASLLLCRLPHVLHVLVAGQRHTSLAAPAPETVALRNLLQPRSEAEAAAARLDLLQALRDVSRFPALIAAEIESAAMTASTTTWFAAFVDALAQLRLVTVPGRDPDPYLAPEPAPATMPAAVPVADTVTALESYSPLAPFEDDLFADGMLDLGGSPRRFPRSSGSAVSDTLLRSPSPPPPLQPVWHSPTPMLLSSLSTPALNLPEIALPLPSAIVHLPARTSSEAAGSVQCRTAADVQALVGAVLAAGGAACDTDLIPDLLDLALTQPAWFARAQRPVCTGLAPVLARAEFALPRATLHACLGRLATPSALQILALYEQLGAVVDGVLGLWRRLSHQPMGPGDDPKLHVEIVAQAQFLLLYATSELGLLETPALTDFRALVLCSQPLTSGHDENKEISTALLSVSSRTHPEAQTYGDAMRLTALKYAPINVLRAVRFGLLPSINQQVPDPERYYNFLRVLIVSLPFVSTVVVEFLGLALQADLSLKKPLSSHAVTWARVLVAIQRSPCSLPLLMYRNKLAHILAGAGPGVEADFSALLGPGHLGALIRHTDARQLLVKHGRYLGRSHYQQLAAAWKEVDLHLPLIRHGLDRAAGLYEFLETLLSGLREPDPHGPRLSDISMFETCAALLSMCRDRIVPRNLRYDKYPLVSFLVLLLTDSLGAEYDAVWGAIVTEAAARKSPDVFAAIAALLACWPGRVPTPAAQRWAQVQLGRGDAALALLALSPSDAEHRDLPRQLLRQYAAGRDPYDDERDGQPRPDLDLDRLCAQYRAVLADR